VILVIPWIGALIYIGTRPSDLEQDVRALERYARACVEHKTSGVSERN
jgi:hypothetical protein